MLFNLSIVYSAAISSAGSANDADKEAMNALRPT
jgi:hypothetical protein